MKNNFWCFSRKMIILPYVCRSLSHLNIWGSWSWWCCNTQKAHLKNLLIFLRVETCNLLLSDFYPLWFSSYLSFHPPAESKSSSAWFSPDDDKLALGFCSDECCCCCWWWWLGRREGLTSDRIRAQSFSLFLDSLLCNVDDVEMSAWSIILFDACCRIWEDQMMISLIQWETKLMSGNEWSGWCLW